MPKSRNGEIDLLRFVFSMVILLYHLRSIIPVQIFDRGNIGVEFFFVVSGFLMAQHVERRNRTDVTLSSVADETWLFTKNKCKSFFRYYLFAFFCNAFIRLFLIQHIPVHKMIYRILKAIPTVTLSFMALNKSAVSLGLEASWYLSAMLIAGFLLYPVLLLNDRFAEKMVFPVVSIFLLGYLFNTYTTITVIGNWTGFTYAGLLRAIAEMALGGFLCSASDSMALTPLSEKPLIKGCLTLLKWLCYSVILCYAHGKFQSHSFNYGFTLHALLFCACGILLSFSNAGYCVPDSRLTRFLGKISLPVYLFHILIFNCWEDYTGSAVNASAKVALLMVLCSILGSIALMYLTDYLCTLFQRLSRNLTDSAGQAGKA